MVRVNSCVHEAVNTEIQAGVLKGVLVKLL